MSVNNIVVQIIFFLKKLRCPVLLLGNCVNRNRYTDLYKNKYRTWRLNIEKPRHKCVS